MNRPGIVELASYAAGMASIGVSVGLNEVGAAVGIATALLTCLTNTIYTWRRDRREQRESDARLADSSLQAHGRRERLRGVEKER